ncbi:MAG: hypothetical protein KatS3mg042_0241 [Rhodothermaceae bacterium]|nr:MAG: hypothetical protein KatS3mg042_0241 [Rhodothermaceae bacterium]
MRRVAVSSRRVRSGFRLFLPVYLVLLVLFAAAYAARYVHPRHLWWLQLLAVGLPVLAVLVTLTTPLLVWRRRWGLLAVHLVALVLVAVRFVPTGWIVPKAQAAPEGPVLTLMTYNLGWGAHRQGPRLMSRQLADLVGAVGPDLFVAQEAAVTYDRKAGQSKPAGYLRLLVDSLAYGVPVPEGSTSHLSKPVLSRFPLDRMNERTLRMADGDVSELVRVEFTWQGRRAVLYNLHLQSYGARKPWHDGAFQVLNPDSWISFARQFRDAIRKRAWQIEEVRRMIDAETLPVLVCGDFNNTPHNWGYDVMTEGFTDAFVQAGRGWGATYHERLPFVRIDYVLAGPAWVVDEAYVVDGHVSDHRPLVVRLRWRDPGNSR